MEVITDAILIFAIVGIAMGRLPRLRMNRASMALAFAAMLIALGSIGLEAALAAIDLGTIFLLLAMMLVIANLRIAGFFTAAGARILATAHSPRALLALIVASSGILSALFLNDTICLMLTPLVVELTIRSKRDPHPYLIGVATSANIGSCATIIGNPQNMLIGGSSGIAFGKFLLRLGPPSAIGLFVCWLTIILMFPREFKKESVLVPAPVTADGMDRRLIAKSLFAAAVMIVLLFAGIPAALAALVAASILLFTRRIDPARVFAEVDFSLLVFFAGLFIITETIAGTKAFAFSVGTVIPLLNSASSGQYFGLGLFSVFTAIFSNLVSNVPTVMLFRPLISSFADSERAWLILAMASTYAGNLTLLGSVANLIVAEGAKPFGVELSFGKYLKAGLPITLVTIAVGTAWLLFI